MTTRNTFASRNRDMQDAFERHVHSEVAYDDKGGMYLVDAKGNGTKDQEVMVLRIGGLWVHLAKGQNADVWLVSMGMDTTDKFALADIPRDKHRKTKAGTSGIQHPTDPSISVEISDQGVRVTGENFAVGKDGTLEVKDGQVYLRGPVRAGKIIADEIETQKLTAPAPTPPGGRPGEIPPLAPVEAAPDLSDYQVS